jgi:hypothetical protein
VWTAACLANTYRYRSREQIERGRHHYGPEPEPD